MFCACTRPRYQVSVYRTIGPLVCVFGLNSASVFHKIICYGYLLESPRSALMFIL